MPLHVKQGGAWKGASPSIKAGGSWKQADAWVKASGVWYRATQSGLDIVIDSASPLYDFNLKTWMQGAGLWPASGPVTINTLTVTARTHITTSERSAVVPQFANYLTDQATPPINANGFKWMKRVTPAGALGSGQTQPMYGFMFAQDLNRYAFTMGTGWPVGSIVNTFNVQGFIYGRGGDGDCSIMGQAYTLPAGKSYNWYANDGTYTDSLVAQCPSGHGDHGLDTAGVVIKTLNVTGGVYGGGAGASLGRLLNVKRDNAVYITNPPPTSEPFDQAAMWPLVGTGSFTGLTTWEPLALWGPSQFGRKGVNAGNRDYMFTYTHGCGGGQGGGRGGKAQPVYRYQAITVQAEVQSGGDGTFAGIGVSPSAPAQYIESDKVTFTYRSETYITPVAGGWGQDSTPGMIKNTTPYYSMTETAIDVPYETTPAKLSSYILYGYKGGTAIKGVGSITSIINPTNIKGAQKV